MSEERERLILLRLSAELTTKGRGTRRRFTRKLAENVREALRSTGHPCHVESQWTRLFARSAAPDAVEALTRVPGLSSISVVEGRCAAELDEIVRVGTELFAERVKGRSYAVRAHRAGTHSFRSIDIHRQLGAALNPGARVDLSNPEVEVEVEVRDQWAYFFSGRTPALGGLPLGVEGRAVCLISGGFDSAVAAWLMLKRGVELDYVFCNLAGEAYESSVVQVSRVLSERWSYGTRPALHVVDFGAPLDELRAHSQPRFWQLVLKRLMYRAARQIAAETGALAIVTGEAIGQVSSQTLANLAAIEGAVDLPVLRPLVGFDKGEIVDLTRRIGTFDLSARVKEYCAIAPGNPVTRATPAAAAAEEAKLDAAVIGRAVEARRVLRLGELTAADMVESYLFTEEVPENAVVIDVRGEDEWGAWHYPGSLRRDPWELAEHLRELDRDRTYLLYCDAGTQAVFLAERMQREGLEAYAFRGGTHSLRARAADAGS
jgi:thiamine biosynthesis protein ThiI